jgi:hypothetical protein
MFCQSVYNFIHKGNLQVKDATREKIQDSLLDCQAFMLCLSTQLLHIVLISGSMFPAPDVKLGTKKVLGEDLL